MDAYQSLDSRLLAEQVCRKLRENDRPTPPQAIHIALTPRQYLQFHFARQARSTVPRNDDNPSSDARRKDSPGDEGLDLL